MSYSVNLASSGCSSQCIDSSDNLCDKRIMGFLFRKISDVFNNTDQSIQRIELAKEVFASKKKTVQETEEALKRNTIGSTLEEDTIKVLSLFLQKIPGDPMQEGLKYIKTSPGYHPKLGFHVPCDWNKNQTVVLYQIYRDQFFVWALSNSHLSFGSILSMFEILRGFSDPSVQLSDELWNKLLLQLTGRQKEQLGKFQSKYRFLQENKFLQGFPIGLQDIKTVCDLQSFKYGLYRLWRSCLACTWMIFQGQWSFSKQMILDEFMDLGKQCSDPVSMHKVKKLLTVLQSSQGCLKKTLSSGKERTEQAKKQDQLRLQWIREKQSELDEDLSFFIQFNEKFPSSSEDRYKEVCNITEGIKNISNVLRKPCLGADEEFNIDEKDEYKLLIKQLQGQVISRQGANVVLLLFADIKKVYFDQGISLIEYRKKTDRLFLLKKEVALIDFFVNYVSDLITAEQTQKKQERECLPIDQFEKLLEGFELESKSITLRDQPKQTHIKKLAEVIPETIQPNVTSVYIGSKEPANFNIDKIQVYINDPSSSKQINGCLSQALEDCLQSIKLYLYQSQQGKEVYDHLLLGTAALEHMAQAIHEGRKNHAVLGFRSALIHCNFAVEQALGYSILQKTGKQLDSHNLLYLAEQLEQCSGKPISQSARGFLEEIKVHLYFRYPEDYRLYFAHNESVPRAFYLLDALSQPGIQIEDLQEAVCFSFEKHCQTLEFILNLLEDNIQNTLDFKNAMNAIQKQLHTALGNSNNRKISASSSLTKKVEIAEQMLHSLNDLVHVTDFEDGWLLATFYNMKHYLQLMKISLNIPQTASEHSLQKFIHVETLLNMDKLFKHLFRAISILRLGKDYHAHDLKEFFPFVDTLSKQDKTLLKKINIAITHHYLHKSSSAELKKEYEDFLEKSFALSSIEQGFHVVGKNEQRFSHQILQKIEGRIVEVIKDSLDLLVKLLKPVVQELEKINTDIEEETQIRQRVIV